MSHTPNIVALTATYKRPQLLKRLLESLEKSTLPVSMVLVDNACDPETEAIVNASSVKTYYLPSEKNLGAAGGLVKGEQFILGKLDFTHLLILDDDAVVYPDTVEQLYQTMEKHGAEMVVPAILNDREELAWSPGVVAKRAHFNFIHQQNPHHPHSAYVERFGLEPLPVTWCTGIAVLVSRRALEQCGLHRDIFWIRGEDLDFSLRISHSLPSLFVPGARVKHLPPHSGTVTAEESRAEYLKHQAMLQNVCFLAFRCSHGRRILKHIPGNFYRFFKIWGIQSFPAALGTFWRGAILKRPYGAERKE